MTISRVPSKVLSPYSEKKSTADAIFIAKQDSMASSYANAQNEITEKQVCPIAACKEANGFDAENLNEGVKIG